MCTESEIIIKSASLNSAQSPPQTSIDQNQLSKNAAGKKKKKGRKSEISVSLSRRELQVKQLIAKWSTNGAYSQENIGRRQTISLVNSTKKFFARTHDGRSREENGERGREKESEGARDATPARPS